MRHIYRLYRGRWLDEIHAEFSETIIFRGDLLVPGECIFRCWKHLRNGQETEGRHRCLEKLREEPAAESFVHAIGSGAGNWMFHFMECQKVAKNVEWSNSSRPHTTWATQCGVVLVREIPQKFQGNFGWWFHLASIHTPVVLTTIACYMPSTILGVFCPQAQQNMGEKIKSKGFRMLRGQLSWGVEELSWTICSSNCCVLQG